MPHRGPLKLEVRLGGQHKKRYAANDIRINLEELEVKEPGKPEQSMATTRSTGGLATDEILAEVAFSHNACLLT